MKESKGFVKKMDQFFEEFINSKGHYLVLVILLSFVLLGVWAEYANSIFSKIMSGFYAITFIVGLYLIVRMLLKKIDRSGEMIWPLATSIVMIMLSAMLNRPESIKASNISFVIGVMSFEIYALHIIISSCFKDKTNINKVIIFSAVFVILGYYTIFATSYKKDATDNEIFNSLIALFSAIIGGGITLIGVGLTIKNQESSRLRQKDEESLKKCPFITFDEIDAMKAEDTIFVHNNETTDCLLLNGCKNKCDTNYFHESSMFIRFKFKCKMENQLKNITIKEMRIHPKFDRNTSDDYNEYKFVCECENYKDINVSLAQDSIYQSCVHLIFGEENSENRGHSRNINRQRRDEMILNMVDSWDKSVFFNISYVATNMDNVSYSGTLKFYCHIVDNCDGSYACINYSNISNWIETKPYILKENNK